METAARTARSSAGPVAVALGVALVLGGCIIEREFAQEDAVDAPAEPGPYASPVQVVASYPPDGAEDVPIDSPVWFEVDQYLDVDALVPTGTIRLQSGGVFASVQVQYEMVGRRLVGRLRAPLQPDFAYTMTLDPARVRSVSGAPLLEAPTIRFTTGSWRSEPGSVQSEVPGWEADIVPIVERSCGCHRLESYPETWFELPQLSYARIVGQPSQVEPDERLVVPYVPARSVLMWRILPDYPRRHGTVMPPPWADDVERTRALAHAPLSVADARLLEDWIQAGAQP